MADPRPPRWAEALLRRLLPEAYRDHQLGDLAEEYGVLRAREGRSAADRWYRSQVLRSLGAAVRLRLNERKGAEPRGGSMMESWAQDIRYAVRSLLGSPMYATIAAVTLALGIGVNTAIFSLVNQLLFLELPMEEPETLAWVWTSNRESATDIQGLSVPDFQDIAERSRSFESIGALVQRPVIISGVDRPARVTAGFATVGLLTSWDARLEIGRGFLEGEDLEGAAPVTILSRSLWLDRFGGDPGVLGTTIRLDGTEHTIIGVGSEKMEVGNLGRNRLWVPLTRSTSGEGREERAALVTGRLRAGVSVAEANREIQAIGRTLAEEYPATNRGWEMQARSTNDSLIGDEIKQIYILLVVTVGMVLLIACANVANLVLVRSSARGRELAVRAALGARRSRVIRQLLTENVMIALVAGAVGLGLAKALLVLMVDLSRGEVIFTMATIDVRVLAFTLLVSLVAPLLFGLFPALAATRTDVTSGLREGTSRTGSGKGTNRVRNVLVTVQIAVALGLMVGSGLGVRSMIRINQIDWGYDTADLLTMVVDLPTANYTEAEAREFFEELRLRGSEVAGVRGFALASSRPGPASGVGTPFAIEGRVAVDALDLPAAYTASVSPELLDVLGIPMLQGRGIEVRDAHDAPPVALVNREAAERFWPESDPIGARIRIGVDESNPWRTVVGVTEGYVSGNTLTEAEQPQVFIPFAQSGATSAVLMARTQAEVGTVTAALRQAVETLDPEQPVDDVRTMDAFLYDLNAVGYALIALFATFALFALVMASMGIYGVMSYMVSKRTSEISLRMALGAERGDVLRMVMVQGGRLVLFGGLAGMALAFVMSRAMANLVFGIEPTDPVTFIGVPAVLLVIALVANYLPAYRATRIDPMSAMRNE